MKVAFLGHLVSKKGTSPDPVKVKAVKEITAPCLKETQSFLSLASYYQCFIPNFPTIDTPLTKLTKAKLSAPFYWADECENLFRELKCQLSLTPLLAYPKFEQEFTLYTDASDVRLGIVFFPMR